MLCYVYDLGPFLGKLTSKETHQLIYLPVEVTQIGQKDPRPKNGPAANISMNYVLTQDRNEDVSSAKQ